MRTLSKAWLSLGAVITIAALGLAHPAKAQSEGASSGAPYNPETWVAPEYPARFLPPEAAPYKDIDGHHLHDYVDYLASISRRYRDNGHPQYWGRILTQPSEIETAEWIEKRFKEIGLSDVHIQKVNNLNPTWMPKSWDVSLEAGGQSMKLTSAQPPYGTASTGGKVLDLPVVYVGLGKELDYANKDVRGKAVFFIKGDVLRTGSVSGLEYAVGSEDDLKAAVDHGAAAIISTDSRGGNFHVQAYRTGLKIPVFELGTEDGFAVRAALAKGSSGDEPHIRIMMDAAWEAGRTSDIAWGTLPGTTDETIYITAHHDGWFDGADDDGSGVATELGLAEHFAKIPKAQRKRTIVFISEPGHHDQPEGANATWWLYLNMDQKKLFAKTALLINAEHTAAAIAHAGTTGRTDAVEPMWWYAGGPSRPNLTRIALDAWHEFAVPLFIEPTCPTGKLGATSTHKTSNDPKSGTVTYTCRRVSGELGELGEWWKVVPSVIIQSSNFAFMHTSQDTPEIVPWTGLQASTQAYAKIIDEVNKLPLSALQRPPETPLRSYPNASVVPVCAAWIKDSSVRCQSEQAECDEFVKKNLREVCTPVAKKD